MNFSNFKNSSVVPMNVSFASANLYYLMTLVLLAGFYVILPAVTMRNGVRSLIRFDIEQKKQEANPTSYRALVKRALVSAASFKHGNLAHRPFGNGADGVAPALEPRQQVADGAEEDQEDEDGEAGSPRPTHCPCCVLLLRRVERWLAERGIELAWRLVLSSIILNEFIQGVSLETLHYQQPVPSLEIIVPIARGCGRALNASFMFMLLFMARLPLTVLQSTKLATVLPFDAAFDAHIATALLSLALVVGHGLGQLVNFLVSPLQQFEAQDGIFSPLYVFVTGCVLTACFVLMGALRAVRVRHALGLDYQAFLRTHRVLWFPFAILLALHGVEKGQAVTFVWLIAPMLLLLIHQVMLKTGSLTQSVVMQSSTADSGVSHLEVLRNGFAFQPGQFAQLCIPALGSEFHPFSIASSPHEVVLKFHIKAAGDWTNRLYELVLQKEAHNLDIIVRGPFGAPTEFCFQYSNVTFVAAGVGVTPFLSVLKDLVARSVLEFDMQEKMSRFFTLASEHQVGVARAALQASLDAKFSFRGLFCRSRKKLAGDDKQHASAVSGWLDSYSFQLLSLWLGTALNTCCVCLTSAGADSIEMISASPGKLDESTQYLVCGTLIIFSFAGVLLFVLEQGEKLRQLGFGMFSVWHATEFALAAPFLALVARFALLSLFEDNTARSLVEIPMGVTYGSFLWFAAGRLVAVARVVGGRTSFSPPARGFVRESAIVDVFFVTTTFKESQWLVEELAKIEAAASTASGLHGRNLDLKIHVHMTREKAMPQKWDLASSPNLGRPAWQTIFGKMPCHTESIGIFYCGNSRLGSTVRRAAFQIQSKHDEVQMGKGFVFFKEAF